MRLEISWSWPSLILYIILGMLSMWMIHNTMKIERIKGQPISWNNKYIIINSLIWTIFATFRLVTEMGLGGMDAPSYIMFFENSNNTVYTAWMEHVGDDWAFKWINKIIRYISSDYHSYFAVVYGFMAWAYLWFAVKFTPAKNSIIPYILCFFLYWRSFNTLRSNLAISFIMIGCTFMLDKKWKYAYLFAILSALTHKASLLYALVIPFVQIFNKFNLKIWHIIAMIILSSVVGGIFQNWFIQYTQEADLQGAYGSYASRSLESGGFFANAWKLAFEQMLLGGCMALYANRIRRLQFATEFNERRVKYIWLMCVFDMILIPINFILGIWRGYEFMYLPRIVMWGIILSLILSKFQRIKSIIAFFIFILFMFWFSFRIERMYETSGLMPYIFDPFLLL